MSNDNIDDGGKYFNAVGLGGAATSKALSASASKSSRKSSSSHALNGAVGKRLTAFSSAYNQKFGNGSKRKNSTKRRIRTKRDGFNDGPKATTSLTTIRATNSEPIGESGGDNVGVDFVVGNSISNNNGSTRSSAELEFLA
jgi:hypothetical protein